MKANNITNVQIAIRVLQLVITIYNVKNYVNLKNEFRKNLYLIGVVQYMSSSRQSPQDKTSEFGFNKEKYI